MINEILLKANDIKDELVEYRNISIKILKLDLICPIPLHTLKKH